MIDSAVCPKCNNPMAMDRRGGFVLVDGEGNPKRRRQRCFACDPPKLRPVSGYSPGPWRVEIDWTYEVYGSDGGIVAKVYDGKDARLIAAAPELLEGLRGMVALAAESQPNHSEAVAIHRAVALIRRIEAATTPPAEPTP